MITQVSQPAPVVVGVDVAKAELVVCEWSAADARRCFALPNRAPAIEAYVQALATRGFSGRMIVESTGHWQWPLVFAATEQGLDVRLINPLQAAKHRQGRIRKCKTDRADAELLAEMAFTEKRLAAPFALSRAAVQLRQRLRLIQNLERTIQQLQSSLRAHQEAAALAGVVPSQHLATLTASLTQLKAQRRALQAEVEANARALACPETINAWAKLPGVSAALGAVLACVLADHVASAKSWVAFVGLDVSVRQSGRYRGQGKLTKRGSPILRKRLYQAAWGAAMNDPHGRRYYDSLRQRGRAHQEALVIIARKLLKAGYALVRQPTLEANSEKLFAVGT